MKITGIKLYTISDGDTGVRGAAMGESHNIGEVAGKLRH